MRDAMLSHLQTPPCAEHPLSCSRAEMQCSRLRCAKLPGFLAQLSGCNACKLSRQSVGLIEPCATMRTKQFNRCPGRLVLSSCARDKALQIVQILCTAFAMRVVHISTWSTAHPVGCMCCTCANVKTCNSHLSHKWYKMTTGSDPRHIKLGKKGQQGHDARTKSCPHYYYFNNFIVIILFLCIRQLQLTNMIFLLRWCGFWPNTNINILVRDCITVGSTTNMAVY